MIPKITARGAKWTLAVLAAAFAALPGQAQDAPDPAPETSQAQSDGAEPAEAAEQPEEGNEAAPGQEAGAEQPAAAGEPVEEAAGAAGEAADDGGPIVVDAEDGSVLDDQTFEGDDEDFIPTEQIPIDEPIPFPTDI